jgi:hypothetical protein
VAPALEVAEDAFVSESKMERWLRSGAATRAGPLLTTRDGRRYVTREGVRVLGRRNGDSDPYGLTGRVETLRDFMRQGAAVSSRALRLGPAVYDIEHGFLVTPIEPAATGVVRLRRTSARGL